MRLFAILLASSFVAAGQRTADPSIEDLARSFRQALGAIMRASGTEFEELEGARIENRRRESFYEAKTYLPEAGYCRIFHRRVAVYCCDWPVKNYAEAKARYTKLIGMIESALGADWTRTTKSSKTRAEDVFSARERKAVVHGILDMQSPAVYVLVLPARNGRDGFTGEIPSIERFVRPSSPPPPKN